MHVAGGHGFKSHLSSLISMRIEKKALRFASLPGHVYSMKVVVLIT